MLLTGKTIASVKSDEDGPARDSFKFLVGVIHNGRGLLY